MDFTTAVRTCLQKYANFTGRARRSEYWWFVLFNILVAVVAGIVDGALFGAQVLGTIVALALLIPGIAVGVRRLHDLDKSGWWMLLVLIPLIGALVLIFFFVQKGTDGANRFGPDPVA